MHIRAFSSGILVLALLSMAGCGEEPVDEATDRMLMQDAQLSRALHDPLMVDPDLAWRNEANAIIAYRDGHPLPLFEARDDAAIRAREAARGELLRDGQIPSLPSFTNGAGGVSLADLRLAGEMVEAVGAPRECVSRLQGDLLWSTRMPEEAPIMPHGMVQQAAGISAADCDVRVVRYLVPVAVDDVLEYHFTKVERARFDIALFDAPEKQLVAERRDRKLVMSARPGPRGMTAVDLVYWRK